ncbi:hypothetical protein CASFOL_035643 [Castilleja foliolosa]|uniref:Uncharacterized protein n=1 Tax=Castilleja foliolosa TaxID=1961234 RepID=A0ABD3BUF9_9LAMI
MLLFPDVEVELNTNPEVFVELIPNPGVVLGNACDVPVVKPVAKADGLGTSKTDEFALAVAEFDELKPNPRVDLKSIPVVFGTPNKVLVPEDVGKPKEGWLDGAGSVIGPKQVFDDPANTKITSVPSHQDNLLIVLF